MVEGGGGCFDDEVEEGREGSSFVVKAFSGSFSDTLSGLPFGLVEGLALTLSPFIVVCSVADVCSTAAEESSNSSFSCSGTVLGRTSFDIEGKLAKEEREREGRRGGGGRRRRESEKEE